MYNWRITKYNPSNRDESGRYNVKDWTSFYDIGKEFNGEKVTVYDYLQVEEAYIRSILAFIDAHNINYMTVKELERPEESLQINRYTSLYTNDMINMYKTLKEDDTLNTTEIEVLSRLILREHIWCKLQHGKTLYVHFGYDYYLYMGSPVKNEHVLNMIKQQGLFVEEFNSPYNYEI